MSRITLVDLNKNENASKSIKTSKYLSQLATLLGDVQKRDLPESLVSVINEEVNALNTTKKTDYALHKFVKAKYLHLIKLVEKEVKLVPTNYYRNLWFSVGMAAFGFPLGIAIALSLGDVSLLSLGIPLGMAIGVGVGKKMDKKAKIEGRQFDFEMVY
jgi:hypothetical protein